jgi:hypothetical protein
MPPRTPEAEQLIKEIRKIRAPEGTLIGGVAADYADAQIGIAKTMPWALLWIALYFYWLNYSANKGSNFKYPLTWRNIRCDFLDIY